VKWGGVHGDGVGGGSGSGSGSSHVLHDVKEHACKWRTNVRVTLVIESKRPRAAFLFDATVNLWLLHDRNALAVVHECNGVLVVNHSLLLERARKHNWN
jgi:hypothetical protein